jgi:ATP-dependent DNA helicase RecG
MSTIDVKELSKLESEWTEGKENVADTKTVIKTEVASANDYSNLGGSYNVCGAKETWDEYGFQKLIETGLTSPRLKESEGNIVIFPVSCISSSLP